MGDENRGKTGKGKSRREIKKGKETAGKGSRWKDDTIIAKSCIYDSYGNQKSVP